MQDTGWKRIRLSIVANSAQRTIGETLREIPKSVRQKFVLVYIEERSKSFDRVQRLVEEVVGEVVMALGDGRWWRSLCWTGMDFWAITGIAILAMAYCDNIRLGLINKNAGLQVSVSDFYCIESILFLCTLCNFLFFSFICIIKRIATVFTIIYKYTSCVVFFSI